jgi:hypothetical protein
MRTILALATLLPALLLAQGALAPAMNSGASADISASVSYSPVGARPAAGADRAERFGVPPSAFRLQDTSTHGDHYIRNGAIIGAIAGAAWGVHEASMVRYGCIDNPCGGAHQRLIEEVAAGALGGVLGAPLGALVGWLVKVGSR